MTNTPSRGRTVESVCYRCEDSLDNARRIRLTVIYEGAHADQFCDLDRRVCLDCLAAIGMLEFATGEAESNESKPPALRNRLSPVRALRGDD